MDEPSRLALGEGTFESSVLEAWRQRQPSESARMKTLVAVGIGGATLTAGGLLGNALSVAPKALVGSSAFFKWLGVGAGIVVAAGGATYLAERATRVAAPTSTGSIHATAAPAPLPAASALRHALVHEAAPLEPGLDPGPNRGALPVIAPVAGPSVARTAVSSAPPSESTSSLDSEVAAIDQARRQLAAGDANAALQLVDAYDARYPGGALGQESAEIRIEALLRTGKRAAAQRLGDAFLLAHPSSPYARIIRGLLVNPTPP